MLRDKIKFIKLKEDENRTGVDKIQDASTCAAAAPNRRVLCRVAIRLQLRARIIMSRYFISFRNEISKLFVISINVGIATGWF